MQPRLTTHSCTRAPLVVVAAKGREDERSGLEGANPAARNLLVCGSWYITAGASLPMASTASASRQRRRWQRDCGADGGLPRCTLAHALEGVVLVCLP
eukprot:scaffold323_cov414-Prasinococcus_capsulatus_cf.AAC.10